MKKILFVSSIVPKEFRNELIKGARLSIPYSEAANTYQQCIIDGLLKNNVPFDVYTAPSLPAYPMGYKFTKIPHIKTTLEGKYTLNIIPYSTVFLWKYTSIEYILEKHISNWIIDNKMYELAIIIYNVNPAFMGAVKRIKKKYPNVITSMIVTDMIEDANNFAANRSFFKRIQIKFHKCKVFSSYYAIDKYILLSEYMKERIPNCKDNYIVLEGIYTPQEIQCNASKQDIIFYSGTLQPYGNVPELIEAFTKIDNCKYKLVICGSGDFDYIKDVSLRNPNIIFLGSIPREEVLKWQTKASFLINPRQSSEITKYSFPSKTMEYFASGTPVLMYRLQGVPVEYYDYCYTIQGTSIDDFANSLKSILTIDKQNRQELAEKAKEFIYKNKTSKMQVSKILHLIYN